MANPDRQKQPDECDWCGEPINLDQDQAEEVINRRIDERMFVHSDPCGEELRQLGWEAT